ncbi:hypothetical protein N7540_008011 [Penicillium herquei]|nr:hypothetical protein N7540_008011 [Penicillium herquei]
MKWVPVLFVIELEMAPHFPFVAIPDIPPAKLYAESPFLFKTMVMVTSYRNRSFQHQLGTKLTEEVGKRLLVDGERSLDVLQGLLIHIAWFRFSNDQSPSARNRTPRRFRPQQTDPWDRSKEAYV